MPSDLTYTADSNDHAMSALTSPAAPLALIAEDEPLLAQSLQAELRVLWPQLRMALATDGLQAVQKALELLPDVLLCDVRMPGLTGLEAVQDIADQWPADRPLPLVVFVTAFDEYAVQAFEQAALDYIVKPARRERLQQAVQRLQQHLDRKSKQNSPSVGIDIDKFATQIIANDEQLLSSLRQLVHSSASLQQATAPPKPQRLQRIQASVGNQLVFVPIEDVHYFEAADKYVRILTTQRELLIRTPIKDLLPQLDEQEFWQIHRSTVVRASLIESATRDEAGKLFVQLRGRADKLAVSRLYAHLFRAM
jgi:DNA-binding LytR/AlgR family response regulator